MCDDFNDTLTGYYLGVMNRLSFQYESLANDRPEVSMRTVNQLLR